MGNGNNGSKGGNLLSRVAYSFGNVGQSAFYNALSTYFIVYVTSSLFAGVDKGVATKLIGIITGLVVVIRIAEIFIDPLLGNIIDNTNTKWGRFKPWQLIGGTVSAILLVLVYTGLFGLVNVNTTLFIVLFIITFIVLDVFYSLRDISYWGMIPALSSDSHERSTYTALGSFGGSIGYNGLTIVVIPIVTYFSWVFTGKYVESQSGWTCFAIIVAILGILTVCSVAFGMGLTPLEGLVMGTRSGDIDPAIMEFIAKKENLDIEGIMNVLNKKSGVEGLSGVSSDFRDLEAAYNEGNPRAIDACEVFAYRVAKYIGSYVAAMNGVDAIAFTAGIGENTSFIREKILAYLGYLGITMDAEKNNVRGVEEIISTPDSKVTVCVIPTNEELAICRETVALVK